MTLHCLIVWHSYFEAASRCRRKLFSREEKLGDFTTHAPDMLVNCEGQVLFLRCIGQHGPHQTLKHQTNKLPNQLSDQIGHPTGYCQVKGLSRGFMFNTHMLIKPRNLEISMYLLECMGIMQDI
ncbi:hypothetical protein WN51_02853 [Melipona quadrifasciata]|uniref:Uncharacterized protein n=1 Tax=Melipona quadrifasciata TaxID=166423 RepID=A0A0M9A8V1_9HYME|nr:hypothetical protein WN51_02853 [Melipona quadrifasciata]